MAGQDATAAYAEPDAANGNQAKPAADALARILQSPNLAAELEPEQLAKISDEAIRGYKLDCKSREDAGWTERTKAAMDLAMLLTGEKDYPFKGAANAKYPLLTT